MSWRPLAASFAAMARENLGENLVGVYVHGSAVMDCFNPAKSDLDLLAVVDQEISDDAKRAFLRGVLALNETAPAKGLELSVVRREFCKPFVHPMPYELRFSNAHLDWLRRDMDDYVSKMKGVDPDLAAHVTILNHRGQTVFGAPREAVFGPVSRADYVGSIWFDVQNAAGDVKRDPMYICLNLCRVLAYLREGLVLSKREGGAWGIRAMPEHASLLEKALGCYETDAVMAPCGEAEAFAGAMLEKIRQYL